MQAAFYTRNGPDADVFTVGDQPTPEPGPGEVRVRIRASGANPSDWKTRKGGPGRKLIAPLIVPHSDGAGDIDAVGDGVPASRIGERVWIWNGQWKRPFGTAAEFIALPSEQAVALPANVSYDEGACMGIPGLTALQAVRLADPQPGMTVLVQAGAGSVGHYAVQMAKLRGATVVATVSSEAKAAHARAAGADHTIDYRRDDVAARVAEITGGKGVDCIIEMDVAANAAKYPTMLRPHGTVVVYGMSALEATLPTMWLMQNSITLKFFLVYELSATDRAACVQELGALLAAGKLQHTIALRLPLADVARAHDLIEGGTLTGNVVLQP
ncbi:MAG: NADPH:quinone reductase [Comamonadaceae bacterium]|nr:MAG: NADPH:quinone reductase [Comamonadaceae bacterium]